MSEDKGIAKLVSDRIEEDHLRQRRTSGLVAIIAFSAGVITQHMLDENQPAESAPKENIDDYADDYGEEITRILNANRVTIDSYRFEDTGLDRTRKIYFDLNDDLLVSDLSSVDLAMNAATNAVNGRSISLNRPCVVSAFPAHELTAGVTVELGCFK